MNNFFSKDTSWEIRQQILRYNATYSMSDVERAQFLGLPNGCRMRENAKIISQENFILGEFCWIGEGAILDASGGLTIGSHTSIGLNVMVWTHDSYKLNIKGSNDAVSKKSIVRKPTIIGSGCFIGGPSVIMPGVAIGDKCIIAPMSVVYEDLPNKTIYNPYHDMYQQMKVKNKRICSLEERLNKIEKLINLK